MAKLASYDAVVVGAGPNGLAAAVLLARSGLSVLLVEAHARVGGGSRTEELTLPGYLHDVCSAIHPMAAPRLSFAPCRSRTSVSSGSIRPRLSRILSMTDRRRRFTRRSTRPPSGLGGDADAYRDLFGALVRDARAAFSRALGPAALAQESVACSPSFGLQAIRSAQGLADATFETGAARALFAGCAAHAILPFDRAATAAIGLVLLLAGHAHGWPFPRGGSESIARALAGHFDVARRRDRNRTIDSIARRPPPAKRVLFDVTPRQLVAICGDRASVGLPRAASRSIATVPESSSSTGRSMVPSPGKRRAARDAGTVHLGGTFEEIAAAEAAVWRGVHPERPYVLVAQQSLFDASRAPAGKHTGWAYCHVPHGSTLDMTQVIESQIERFAPGFRDRILARSRMSTRDFQAYNENYVGGDITGGVTDLGQLFTRPVARADPYSTPQRSHLHLLQLHPSRRRRPRHVRLLRRPRRFAPRVRHESLM